MMTWNDFLSFAYPTALLAVGGAIQAARSRRCSRWAIGLTVAAMLVLGTFIVGLWFSLQRPPLRTMGETRLWYSFFLLAAGLFTYIRWKFRWILSCSTLLAVVFMAVNVLKPEIHDQSLMPALQSIWFIPHVTVYMFSYSLLGVSFLLAVYGWATSRHEVLPVADSLVYTGTACLTLGMLSGALWAKEAWGHYWSWDPKETWALITWMCYLLYLHLRLFRWGRKRWMYALLVLSFLSLQMCWYGVNYLPSAQDSVHVYNRN